MLRAKGRVLHCCCCAVTTALLLLHCCSCCNVAAVLLLLLCCCCSTVAVDEVLQCGLQEYVSQSFRKSMRTAEMEQWKDRGWSTASVLEKSERSFSSCMATEAAGKMHQGRRNAAVKG